MVVNGIWSRFFDGLDAQTVNTYMCNINQQQQHTLNDGIFGIAPRRPSKPPLPKPRPNWPDSVFSNNDASDMDVISAVEDFVVAEDACRVGLTADDVTF